MPFNKTVGYVAVALGTVFLVFAWRGSNAPIDQLADAVTGRFSQGTMAYLIAGVGLVIAGALLLLVRPRA